MQEYQQESALLSAATAVPNPAQKPEITGTMVLVNMYFNIGKQLGCILHFIDKYRWLMTLQEHLRVILCHLTLCQIIQSKFSAIIYINYILDEIQEIYTIKKELPTSRC